MRFAILLTLVLLASCAPAATPTPIPTTVPTLAPTSAPTAVPTPKPIDVPKVGAFTSGVYRNLFKEMLGKSDAEIQAKVDAAWKQLFYGDDATERVYYPVGEDIAYLK